MPSTLGLAQDYRGFTPGTRAPSLCYPPFILDTSTFSAHEEQSALKAAERGIPVGEEARIQTNGSSEAFDTLKEIAGSKGGGQDSRPRAPPETDPRRR